MSGISNENGRTILITRFRYLKDKEIKNYFLVKKLLIEIEDKENNFNKIKENISLNQFIRSINNSKNECIRIVKERENKKHKTFSNVK